MTAETGDHQWPAGVARDLADLGPVDVELKRKMRATWLMLPARRLRSREGRSARAGVAIDAGGPASGRHLAHSAEQTFVRGPRPQEDRAVAPHGHPAAPRPGASRLSLALDGQQAWIAGEDGACSPRVLGQSMQRGRFGVQIVAPRSIIACAKSPGRSAGTNPLPEKHGFQAWSPAVACGFRRAAT